MPTTMLKGPVCPGHLGDCTHAPLLPPVLGIAAWRKLRHGSKGSTEIESVAGMKAISLCSSNVCNEPGEMFQCLSQPCRNGCWRPHGGNFLDQANVVPKDGVVFIGKVTIDGQRYEYSQT